MNRLRLSLFVLVALVLLLNIPLVAAEVATGELTGDGWKSSNYYTNRTGTNVYNSYFDEPMIYNIQYTQGAKSFIRFDSFSTLMTHSGVYGTNTSITGMSIPCIFNITVGGTPVTIATGYIGYQRQWTGFPATETYGFQYMEFTTWIGHEGGRTGNYRMSAIYNQSLWRAHSSGAGTTSEAPTGYIGLVQDFDVPLPGNYTFNKDSPFLNNYTVTKPSGIGIQGLVNKTPEGTAYASRITIVDGITEAPITQENTINTNDFNFAIANHQTIKICAYSSNGDWYNTSRIFNMTATPTPTSTPIIPAVYVLNVNSQYVNVSGTIYAEISSLTDTNLDDLTALYYTFRGGLNYDDPFYEIGSTTHATMYEKIGGTWYGYDSADVEYNNNKAGIPSNVTLKWDTTPGTRTLYLHYRTSGGIEGDLTKTIYVGQGNENLVQTSFQAMDGMNGGVVQMVNMQIYNHNTATWTNLSPNTGLGTIITPQNHILSAYVQKAGFSDGVILNKPAQDDYTYTVNLYRASAPATGYVNEFVSVQATGGGYLSGATITITNSTDGKVFTKTSPTNGGAVIFNLTASSLHTYTVVKTGYQTVSGSFTTPASGGSQYLDVRMSYGSVITTVKTTAPIPTGSWTVNPSMTPANQGNLTGFWSPWINVFSKMGASSYEMPLLIAGLIIVLCMAAGFGMGGVLGGEVAMGFGAIFCVSLGLIPIWVVLAIIVLGFLFYGLKIGGR